MTAQFRRAAFAAFTTIVLAACDAPAPTPEVALRTDALETSNGIVVNGIVVNGIVVNGIVVNGIVVNGIVVNGMLTNGLAAGDGTNGLAANGLVEASFQTPEFQAWFARDVAYSDMVMTYVARCALPASVTLTYTTDGSSHGWSGGLGLAPLWGAGQPIPAAEQELVSACLAAHVNRYGQHVSISVRGVETSGALIATTNPEEAAYSWAEGCFFGNLFDGTGTWSAMDAGSLDPTTSTPRGCVGAFGQPTPCTPMAGAGRCDQICAKDPTGAAWASCAVAGRTFRPVQVKLRAASVFHCGDGVCQFTESAETCTLDCAQ